MLSGSRCFKWSRWTRAGHVKSIICVRLQCGYTLKPNLRNSPSNHHHHHCSDHLSTIRNSPRGHSVKRGKHWEHALDCCWRLSSFTPRNITALFYNSCQKPVLLRIQHTLLVVSESHFSAIRPSVRPSPVGGYHFLATTCCSAIPTFLPRKALHQFRIS